MMVTKVKLLVFLVVLSVIGAMGIPDQAQAKNGKDKKSCAANIDHVGFVDQEQCRYDGGLSARMNPPGVIWQSFTAGVTGTLTEVDMGFFGIPNASGTLGIREGEGLDGTLLGAYTTPIVCDGNCMIPFVFHIPVVAGAQYTLVFSPGFSMPDPYGVQVGAHNRYHAGTLGGKSYLGDSMAYDGYDAVFTTFVTIE